MCVCITLCISLPNSIQKPCGLSGTLPVLGSAGLRPGGLVLPSRSDHYYCCFFRSYRNAAVPNDALEIVITGDDGRHRRHAVPPPQTRPPPPSRPTPLPPPTRREPRPGSTICCGQKRARKSHQDPAVRFAAAASGPPSSEDAYLHVEGSTGASQDVTHWLGEVQ